MQSASSKGPQRPRRTRKPKSMSMSLRGLFGNDSEQIQIMGSQEAISLLQSTITQDKLMVASNADSTVPNALTISLESMVELGTVLPLDQLWRTMDDALDTDALIHGGASIEEVAKINEPLPPDAGRPTFQGRRTSHFHASYAFRVCKSSTRTHKHLHGGYRLLITTERLGEPVQVELFSAADNPASTVFLHRTFRTDGPESWKPYRLRYLESSLGSMLQLPEDMNEFEKMSPTGMGDAFGLSPQGSFPGFDFSSMLPQNDASESLGGPLQDALPPFDSSPMPPQLDNSMPNATAPPAARTRAAKSANVIKAKKAGWWFRGHRGGAPFYQPAKMPRSGARQAVQYKTAHKVLEEVCDGDIPCEEFSGGLVILAALGFPNNECGKTMGKRGNTFTERLTQALKERARLAGVAYDGDYRKAWKEERLAHRTRLVQEEAAAAASKPLISAPTSASSLSAALTNTESSTTASTINLRGQSRRSTIVTTGTTVSSMSSSLLDDVLMTGTSEAIEQTEPSTRRSVRIKVKEAAKKKGARK